MAVANKQIPTRMSPVVSEKAIELCLHTRNAVRVWFGRTKTKERYGIMGLPGFSAKMRILENNIRDDDPYAYYYYDVMFRAIEKTSREFDEIEADIDAILSTIPSALKVPDLTSNEPMVFDVNFSSRLGFKAMYQLIKADKICMKVLKAAHVDLISNSDKFRIANGLESKMRALFNLCYKYHNCDVTRDDMAANNQRARSAIDKMGVIPEGYLTGETAVENAPRLPDRLITQQLDAEVDFNESDVDELLQSINNDMDEVNTKLTGTN